MTWDVAIVGAGPAGASLAVRLARRGLAVVVLERARFPRAKACGEFLSPAATPLLEELGVRDAIEAAGARRLGRVRIVVHGEPVDLAFPRVDDVPPWGYALSRRRLDAILLDAARRAGARIREGVRVDGLAWNGGQRVTGVTAREPDGAPVSIRARLVVGAGGRNDPVARGLGLQRRARRRRWDLLARWSAEDDAAPGDVCELHVGDGGYLAAAPLEGGLRNVNCVVSRAALRRTPDPAALYARVLDGCPAVERWTRGAPSPVEASDVTPLRAARATADGALLVGDAALFLDPFTGQGLYLAMAGAALAEPVVAAALAAGRTDARALLPYDAALTAAFDAKRRVSAAIQTLLSRRRPARAVARALRRESGLAATLAAVTGDLVPATRAWSPAFAARLGRAALRP